MHIREARAKIEPEYRRNDERKGHEAMPLGSGANAQLESAVIDELVEIAALSGVTIDRDAAQHWLDEIAAAIATPGEFARSLTGEYGGHELALIDFDPDLAVRFRAIARQIETPESEHIAVALAIAGSAAQGRIQPFPADADFFERIHIVAPDRKTACERLGHAILASLELSRSTSAFELEELYLGHDGGKAISWLSDDIANLRSHYRRRDGSLAEIQWDQAIQDPGFLKIDWTLLDPNLGGPGKVSKAIDATWQAPDGSIVSLDNGIDADFQQVYLDASAADLAAALLASLESGGKDTYLWHMEHEIAKYCQSANTDYAKVAKRLYNYCRLTGRFAHAVYIRELFDEPAAQLHQLRLKLELSGLLSPNERIETAALLMTLADLQSPWCGPDDRLQLREWSLALHELSQAANGAMPEDINDALRLLVSSVFERALRAYSPIALLIEDISQKHPQAAGPFYT